MTSDAPTHDAQARESQTREAFKHAMANYPTGVAVVTTMARSGVPVGLTINSLASVSLTPLMALWSVDRRASCAQEFVQGKGPEWSIQLYNESSSKAFFDDRHFRAGQEIKVSVLVGMVADHKKDRVRQAGDQDDGCP